MFFEMVLIYTYSFQSNNTEMVFDNIFRDAAKETNNTETLNLLGDAYMKIQEVYNVLFLYIISCKAFAYS